MINWIVRNRTVWHLNWVQTNDIWFDILFDKLFEIGLFDDLTVCKQIIDVLITSVSLFNLIYQPLRSGRIWHKVNL